MGYFIAIDCVFGKIAVDVSSQSPSPSPLISNIDCHCNWYRQITHLLNIIQKVRCYIIRFIFMYMFYRYSYAEWVDSL